MKLTAETFRELVQSLRSNPPAGSEKRKKPRVGLRTRAEIALADPATGLMTDRAEVAIRDVSATGLGLTINRQLAFGKRFVLLLDSAESGGQAGDISCTVVHCRRAATDLYRIGARFDS